VRIGPRIGRALLARHPCLLGLLAAGATLAPGAGAAGSVPRGSSSNWSGYSVTGQRFSSVGASWVEPAANCIRHTTSSTDASFWVGPGGDDPRAKNGEIEQIGTDSDCGADGTGYYYAWYELWPAKSVSLRLSVLPGDRISASVHVVGSRVVLRLTDRTTGKAVTEERRITIPDTSSAEWIAEAPAFELKHGEQISARTDFGTVSFSGVSAATVRGHTGTIRDSAWRAGAIEFASGRHGRGASPVSQFFDQATAARGVPSLPRGGGSAFSVTWEKGRPGAAGGAPAGTA